MSIYRSAGIAFGIILGLVIAVILLRVANTNKKIKTDYDERQQMIRGKGYMYGFYTVLVYQALMVVFHTSGLELPIADFSLDFLGVMIGVTFVCSYCIWNHVYWGLNNDHKRYYIIFGACLVLNAIPIIGGGASGNLMEDGKIGLPALNISVIAMMVIILIVMGIREIADRNMKEEED